MEGILQTSTSRHYSAMHVAVKLLLLSFVLGLYGFVMLGYTQPRVSARAPKIRVLSQTPMKRSRRAVQDRPSHVRQERNKLSAMLNNLKYDLAKMACEVQDLRSKAGIKPRGDEARCRRPYQLFQESTMFDAKFADALVDTWYNKTVAVVGDPLGTYKRYFDSRHTLHSCDAFDDAPYASEGSHGAVRFLDLKAPQYGFPVFDWVLFLHEVTSPSIENLEIIVDNLGRHAREGLVLVLHGKMATSAITLRSQRHLFLQGLLVDRETSEILRESASIGELKQGVVVFKRTYGQPSHLDA